MRKNNGWIIVMVMAVVMTASMNALAQKGYWSGDGSCCMAIPGLTEKQKSEITALEKAHRSEMDAMRAERRKTGGYSTREAYQVAVDEKVAAHREKVHALLTEEQKAVFDQNQPRQGQGRWARQSGRGGGQGACPRGRWGGRGRR